MTTKKSEETVDTVVSERNERQVSNSCLAQVGPSSKSINVVPMGDCCTNLIQNVEPISIYMKNVNVAILRGKVICGSGDGQGVEGVIVVATSSGTTKNYVGITNSQGEYSICVPAVTRDRCYTVEAYCCGSCTGSGICEDADCDCGCKNSSIPM